MYSLAFKDHQSGASLDEELQEKTQISGHMKDQDEPYCRFQMNDLDALIRYH